MRKLISSAAAVAVLLGAASAAADELDQGGTDLIIGAERLFGFHFYSNDRGTDNVNFGLLWQRTISPYNVPRATFDAEIWNGLTVGGSLGFYVSDSPDIFGFLLNPRAGFIFDIADDWAIWPRGGLSFFVEDRGLPDDYVEFGLSLDALAVWMPLENVGFTAGPSLDVGLAGDAPGTGNLNEIAFGIEFGTLIHF